MSEGFEVINCVYCNDCIHTNQAYNKAIDDCFVKAKTMMDELSYQNPGRTNGKTHRLYCVQAMEFLRQVAEQLKVGGKNDKR